MKRLKRGMDIEMNLAEFNVLYEVYKEGSVIYQNIVRNTGYESEQVSKVIEGLREKGWIESGIKKRVMKNWNSTGWIMRSLWRQGSVSGVYRCHVLCRKDFLR